MRTILEMILVIVCLWIAWGTWNYEDKRTTSESEYLEEINKWESAALAYRDSSENSLKEAQMLNNKGRRQDSGIKILVKYVTTQNKNIHYLDADSSLRLFARFTEQLQDSGEQVRYFGFNTH